MDGWLVGWLTDVVATSNEKYCYFFCLTQKGISKNHRIE